ncbi:MAG TPA: phosphoribosylformylglycinamidine cyclo-ligase [Actinomycetota bacterium]|jgi:phosphoribosylformylglycinamidine cyclo-ligase|nr:phosphoribosylformylglycinamidine cyclo-ligase [Actinomycetota bacterium]
MSDAYGRAGVDLDAAGRAVGLIRDLAGEATRPEVIEGVGGFAGLFRISEDRLLAAATDGVGTKLGVALAAGRLDTIGVDLVAMCADDVVCTGAEPLFFLDYVATGRLVPEDVAAIVTGVADGCRRAGCALLGGETAEHPGTMRPEELDLAGFCVGVVDERTMLGPHRVQEGDVLIGLASTGLHANGYSLVRKALLEDGGYRLDDVLPRLGRSLGDELLEPTAVYTPLVLGLARDGVVHAAAHVTGGGLVENVPRVMPAGLHADIDWRSWPVPAVFDLVAEASGAGDEELRRTFNLGVGMILVVPAHRTAEVISRGKAGGSASFEIGRVVRG